MTDNNPSAAQPATAVQPAAVQPEAAPPCRPFDGFSSAAASALSGVGTLYLSSGSVAVAAVGGLVCSVIAVSLMVVHRGSAHRTAVPGSAPTEPSGAAPHVRVPSVP